MKQTEEKPRPDPLEISPEDATEAGRTRTHSRTWRIKGATPGGGDEEVRVSTQTNSAPWMKLADEERLAFFAPFFAHGSEIEHIRANWTDDDFIVERYVDEAVERDGTAQWVKDGKASVEILATIAAEGNAEATEAAKRAILYISGYLELREAENVILGALAVAKARDTAKGIKA